MLPGMATPKSKPAKQRMKDYRGRLRREGLRPVQIWVPDQRAEGFSEDVRSQIAGLDHREESEALDFIQDNADWTE